jgi:DNA-binding NarL/FixJ family response regulator
MKSCLVCDDHVLVREAIAGTIRLSWPGAEITEVGDFPSAWAAAAQHPEFCVADLVMPGANPLSGIAGIRQAAPDCRILVVTGTQDDFLLLDLLDLGIAGFAPKTSSGAIIEAALRLIAAGGRYLPQRLAEIAASRLDEDRPDETRDGAAMGVERLTERQREILQHAALGASTKEIAVRLGLAPSTIKSHLAHIQDCLGARNRMDATAKARSLGLI